MSLPSSVRCQEYSQWHFLLDHSIVTKDIEKLSLSAAEEFTFPSEKAEWSR